MKKTIYTTYAPDTDMTFILEDVWDGEELISTEVKGFYFGSPDEEATKIYYGDMKATTSVLYVNTDDENDVVTIEEIKRRYIEMQGSDEGFDEYVSSGFLDGITAEYVRKDDK